MENNSVRKVRDHLSARRNEDEIEFYREEFKKLFDKKILTLGIGFLSMVEEVFGHLWGHGKPKLKLTPEQLAFREEWELLRNNILDNTHNTTECFQKEIDRFDLTRRRYHYTFIQKG
jgi:hypothetical protein